MKEVYVKESFVEVCVCVCASLCVKEMCVTCVTKLRVKELFV